MASPPFKLDGWQMSDKVLFGFACNGLFPEIQTSDGFYDWDCGLAGEFLVFLRSLPRMKGNRRNLIREAMRELAHPHPRSRAFF
jgi:hypothetical protein